MNKYKYLLVIQQSGDNWGWEDVSEYEVKSSYRGGEYDLWKHDVKEYRLSNTGNVRTIRRRELKPIEKTAKQNHHKKGCNASPFALITVSEGVLCSKCLSLIIDNR